MFSVKSICQAALIAALYAALTLVFLPISFGPIQFRVSEMLTVLPLFMASAVPGVTIGCLIANILGGAILPDIVFGTLATLIGAVLTRVIAGRLLAMAGKNSDGSPRVNIGTRLAAVLPPIVSNTLIVPFVLKYAYMYDDALYFMMFTVALGEILGIGVLGNILISVLTKGDLIGKLGKP